MSATNFNSAFLLAALVAMGSTASVVPDADSLISSMGAGKSVLLGMQLAIGNAAKEKKISINTLQCVNHLDPSEFTPVLRPLILTSLTPEEIAEATAFYQSEAGEKSQALANIKLYQHAGQPAPYAAPTFSEADSENVQTFVNTTAGRKLLTDQVLSKPEAFATIQVRLMELLARCRKA